MGMGNGNENGKWEQEQEMGKGMGTGNGKGNGNGNLYKNLHAYPSTQGSDETLGLMAILFTSTARDDSDSR